MASQDIQSFFQPLSSWMSRVYEAVQQAGDSLSSSLTGLGSKAEHRPDDETDEALEDSDGPYEHYSEGSEDESSTSQESEGPDRFPASRCCDPASRNSSGVSSLHWQTGERSGLILSGYLDEDSQTCHGIHQSYKGHQPTEALPTIPEEEEHLHSKQSKNYPPNWDDRRSCWVENSSGNMNMAGRLTSLVAAFILYYGFRLNFIHHF